MQCISTNIAALQPYNILWKIHYKFLCFWKLSEALSTRPWLTKMIVVINLSEFMKWNFNANNQKIYSNIYNLFMPNGL